MIYLVTIVRDRKPGRRAAKGLRAGRGAASAGHRATLSAASPGTCSITVGRSRIASP